MSLTVRDLIAAARTRIREIQPVELLELQQFGCPVVDVREPEEFAEGHIPGAVNIPRGLLEFEVDGHPAVNYQTAEALSHRAAAGDPVLPERWPLGARRRGAAAAGVRQPDVAGPRHPRLG